MRRFLILLFILTFALDSNAQTKKRVAVMNFEYGTVRDYVNTIFGGDQDVGKGIADLLVDKLVKDGVYSVIERKELDKVLTEQNFSNSNRADPSTAAKIGRVLGVVSLNLNEIKAGVYQFAALPLKIVGGDAAPVRALLWRD